MMKRKLALLLVALMLLTGCSSGYSLGNSCGTAESFRSALPSS